MIVLATLIFICYSIVVFRYIGCIFAKPLRSFPGKWKLCLSVTFNSLLLFIPVYVTKFQHEIIVFICYFVVLGVQMLLLFRPPFLRALLALLAFCTNFFATRVLLIGIFSWGMHLPIPQLVELESVRIWISILNFALLTPYILFTQKVLPTQVFDLLMSNRQNLYFSITILLTIFINQLVHVSTQLYLTVSPEEVEIFAVSQIRTGLFYLLLFATAMVCVYIFSGLRKKAIHYNRMSAQLEKEHELVAQLQVESTTESATGFYLRGVAEQQMESYCKEHVPFFLCFIDIDGLKYANDHFGHEEGDRYIKEVANVLSKHFQKDLISRIGGDEFLVVGLVEDSSLVQQTITQCIEQVKAIHTTLHTPYPTSISCGTVMVDQDNTQSVKDLIKIADQKMYECKRQRKMARGTVKVSPNIDLL